MKQKKNKAIDMTMPTTQDEKVLPDEENDDYEIEKDILGNCRLILKKASQSQTGKYACRIKGREKEKNCYTKTEVVVQGRCIVEFSYSIIDCVSSSICQFVLHDSL